MRNKEIALKLEQLLKDEVLSSEEERIVKEAVELLKTGVMTLLYTAFKDGFLHALDTGIKGTNKHITAKQHANAYALDKIRASMKVEEEVRLQNVNALAKR